MFKLRSTDTLLFAGIVFGLIAVILLAGMLENRGQDGTTGMDAEELSLQGGKLKGMALGFEGLLADWYWMRSLQYIGEKLYSARDQKIDIDNLKPLDPKLLYPLLNNAATLDPKFLAVYSYGANVLPAIDKRHAIAIAKKGIANNPEEWRLYHQLGYIYWRLGDYESAASTYSEGSAIRSAPVWMKSMAARMSTEGGSRETARAIYQQLYDTASESRTKESARLRLLELDSLEEIEVLDEALYEFKNRNGACATSWNQILEILRKKRLPGGRDLRVDVDGNVVDPTDAPYLLDPASCRAKPDFSKSELPRS